MIDSNTMIEELETTEADLIEYTIEVEKNKNKYIFTIIVSRKEEANCERM